MTFTLTLIGTATGNIPRIDEIFEFVDTKRPGLREHQGSIPEGEQLVVMYFGQSACVWSNKENLPGAINAIKRELREIATERGWSFMSIGTALDWSLEAGLDHLRKFGPFDEISLGYNWANSSAIKYLSEDTAGLPAIPQVVVVRRKIATVDQGDGAVRYVIEEEHVLARKVGAIEINKWVEETVPLPELGAGSAPESRT
jgi:hypothetical protein